MSANATGTPTTNYSIPTFNTSADDPNGLGVNEMMAAIDAAIIGNSKLTTTGDMLYASAASTPARLGIGTTGQHLVVVSGLPAWKTPAECAASQTGSSTNATTTLKHLGLGSTAAFTPAVSGRMLFTATALGQTNSASDGIQFGGAYGTGTAPAAGATQTGTLIPDGSQTLMYQGGTMAANVNYPIAFSIVVTGLTVGTAYWYDLVFANQAGGTALVQYIHLSAVEV